MYQIGDIFGIDDNYNERANFCNENGLMIVELERISTGERRFQIQKPPQPSEAEKARIEIEILKQKLSETDYKAIKYAEGLISEEEYAIIKTQRQEWRNQINILETKL